MRKPSSVYLGAAAALLLASVSVQAQTNVLRLSGIQGESQVTHHQNDIDISSFSWGEGRAAAQGAGFGPLTISNLVIIKPVDASSPTLAADCANGTLVSTATIYCEKATTTGVIDFYRIVISHVTVSGVASAPGFVPPPNSPTATGQAFETVTLSFGTTSSFQWTYIPVDAGGNAGTPVTSNYP